VVLSNCYIHMDNILNSLRIRYWNGSHQNIIPPVFLVMCKNCSANGLASLVGCDSSVHMVHGHGTVEQ
jgi:hypothetical protein